MPTPSKTGTELDPYDHRPDLSRRTTTIPFWPQSYDTTPMNDLLARYIDKLEHKANRFGRNVSPATIRAARADVHGFIDWWEGQRRLRFDPSLVLERDLRDWQAHRQKEDGAR